MEKPNTTAQTLAHAEGYLAHLANARIKDKALEDLRVASLKHENQNNPRTFKALRKAERKVARLLA